MNAQLIVCHHTRHILRRKERILTKLLFLRFAEQQLGDVMPVDLVGEHIVLVQKVERIVNARPKRQEQCDRCVRTFATRKAFRIGNGIFNVLIAWHHGQLKRLIGMIDLQIARVVAQLKEALWTNNRI